MEVGWAAGGATAAWASGTTGAATATATARSRGLLRTCWTSTAPAVTIAAAARPATALVVMVLMPACAAAAAAPPEAAAPPPLAAAEVPRWASSVFLSRSSGPTGKSAASALLVSRSCLRNVAQRSQVRRWRRTGALVRVSPSATSPSSWRTSSHDSRRASEASASETRARTSSDLTEGTVVSIASAICSYDSASISRSSSAVRWVSGRSCTSAIRSRNSSRRWTLSAVVCPCSDRWMSIESTPTAWVRRRWLSDRLRAIRYSHGRTLIARSSARIALKAAAKTSCSTSSASSFEDSMWRQKASRRDW